MKLQHAILGRTLNSDGEQEGKGKIEQGEMRGDKGDQGDNGRDTFLHLVGLNLYGIHC